MGKDWDKVVIPTSTWKECLRVLKPGAFVFIMSSPRQDVLSRMICNLQDAGFETGFTSIYWTYASGFPKAMNMKNRGIEGAYAGFQPKPAVEVVLVVMKPLSEKSYVDQALSNQKGVTWLDSARIPYQSEDQPVSRHGGIRLDPADGWNQNQMIRDFDPNQKGRFPANLLCSDDVLNDGRITKSPNSYTRKSEGRSAGSFSRYFDLDKWFETTFPFAIVAKASKKERNMGLDKWIYDEKPKSNQHPTVKPLKLMAYLIMLGSRENDMILDPFAGSGTTGLAARMLRRRFVGLEINKEYTQIAHARYERERERGLQPFPLHSS